MVMELNGGARTHAQSHTRVQGSHSAGNTHKSLNRIGIVLFQEIRGARVCLSEIICRAQKRLHTRKPNEAISACAALRQAQDFTIVSEELMHIIRI
jgi:hypothetical protein